MSEWSWIHWGLTAAVVLFLIPCVIYIWVKMGVSGFYAARKDYIDRMLHHREGGDK